MTASRTTPQINVKLSNAQQFQNICREAHMYGGRPFVAKSKKASLSCRADDAKLTIMTITFGSSPFFHTLTSWFHGWHLGLPQCTLMGAMGPLSLSLSPFAHRAPIEDKINFLLIRNNFKMHYGLQNDSVCYEFHLKDLQNSFHCKIGQ